MRMVLGVVAIGLAISAAAPAAGDPTPPDPALIGPTPAAGVAPLAAEDPAPAAPAADGPAAPPSPAAPLSTAQQTKANPVGTLTDLLRGAVTAGSANPAVQQSVPATNSLASVGMLMPQSFGMPTGDQPSPYVLGENTPSGFARIDAYKGAHALLHGSLGRMPGTELGQPLPGTAPPPGTAIPPGLVQYFDPAAGPAVAAGGTGELKRSGLHRCRPSGPALRGPGTART